jgi:type IV pilus assembly protein PilY1
VFVTDADGVVWRADISDPDPSNWVAKPFHDMFWDQGPLSGELSYEAPLLTVDDAEQLIVIVGTGDTENFVKPTVENRVASLTEVITGTGTPTPDSYKAKLNWEFGVPTPSSALGMVPSELVTGSMALFQGQLFFGTFIAITGSDACNYGSGRIHAVDYHLYDTSVQNNRGFTLSGTSNGSSSGARSYGPVRLTTANISTDASTVINVPATSALSNFLVMGLGITQRTPCSTVEPENGTDLFGQSHPRVTDLTPPSVYLVAQASGTNSLVNRATSQALGSVQLKLTKKKTVSRVTSWATSVD